MKPEHLEKIRATVLEAARHFRNDGQEVPPALFVWPACPDGELGELAILDLSEGDITAPKKDLWAKLQQMAASSEKVVATALLFEAWMCRLEKDEECPESVAAREDKSEVFMVNVMSASRQWVLMAEIKGNVIADAPLKEINLPGQKDTFEGRFVRDAKPLH